MTAPLILGQKMFMEDRVIDDDRVHTHSGSVNSIIAGSHIRNMSGVEDRVKITGIRGTDDFSIDDDSFLFVSGYSAYEDEDQLDRSSYGYAVHNSGGGEKTADSHGRNGNDSIHTGPVGSAVKYPAGLIPGNTGRSYAGRAGHGAGGGWGGNGSGGKGDTGKDSAGNAPGTNAGTTLSQEKAAPAHEDKNDPERDNKQNGEHLTADGKEATNPAGNLPDKEISPYFDAPPGTPDKEPGDPFQSQIPQIPAEEVGNPDYREAGEGPGTSGNPGARAIPEPASSLLIGLGGVMLLWPRRRDSRS